MQIIDGRAYTSHGATGTFLADAALSLIACILALMLKFFRHSQNPLAELT